MTSANPRHTLRRLGVSVILAGLALLSFSAVASAYTSGGVGGVTSGCSSTDTSCNFTFNFKDQNGAAECQVPVTIGVTGVTGSSVQPTHGTTDCNGNVQALFSAGNSGCGTATITASTSDATARATVTVPCDKGELPNTSTLPPTTPSWWAGLAVLAALVITGGGFALRRMRSTA